MANTSGGERGFGNAARAAGSRGVQYVSASSARQTAVLLIVAILLARLVLTHQLQQFWGALWGPMKPLGSGLPGKTSGAAPANKGGGGSAGSF